MNWCSLLAFSMHNRECPQSPHKYRGKSKLVNKNNVKCNGSIEKYGGYNFKGIWAKPAKQTLNFVFLNI